MGGNSVRRVRRNRRRCGWLYFGVEHASPMRGHALRKLLDQSGAAQRFAGMLAIAVGQFLFEVLTRRRLMLRRYVLETAANIGQLMNVGESQRKRESASETEHRQTQ